MTLATGARLGPYEIVSPLGAGGMGVVYKARDTRLDRLVAIKVLAAGYVENAQHQRRFEQEARAVAQLQHPNILVLHDVGTHEGSPYLVSEFLEGETLRELLLRGPLALSKVLEYGCAVAYGLAAAHDKGIAHRDLKPENILITKDGRAKILDFGLAKLADTRPRGSEASQAGTRTELSQAGTVMGTVGYMSPEQVRAEEVDARSDIFSFGAVLYEMVSGRRAFQRPSPAESQVAILREDPPELSAAGAVAPPGLELVIKRCIEKDRARRFQSAHDLAFSLETLGTLSGSVATPAVARDRPPNRRWLAPVGTAVLTLAGLATGWLLARRSHSTAEVTFQQLTFQQGVLTGARFAPDGQTIVYSGRFGAGDGHVFTTRPGSTEFRALDLPEGTSLFAVSSAGDLAVRLASPENPGHAVLARVPLAGGVPRPLLEGVVFADWSPDGKDLAVVRTEARPITYAAAGQAGISRIEFPIGTKLLEVPPPNRIGRLRVSPDGKLVAFIERLPGLGAYGRVCTVDRRGVKKVLSTDWAALIALAWSARGDEVYFDGTKGKNQPAIRAVDLNGHERVVVGQGATDLTFMDSFRDRLLVQQAGTERMELLAQRPGETADRNIAWLNWSDPADLSADGKRVLFDETRAGVEASVYLRATDGAPPVRLGSGLALALSPDGAWAAAVETRLGPSPLLLIPTGPGEARKLPSALIYNEARFFPDGRALLVRASETGRHARLYVQDLASGHAEPITPEGVTALALAPDGSRAATVTADQRLMVYPVHGGEGSPVAASRPGDLPLQWSADGNALFVNHPLQPSRHEIYRLDLTTGLRELWRSITTSDAGISIRRVLLTPDARGHVFALAHQSSELYLIEGVR